MKKAILLVAIISCSLQVNFINAQSDTKAVKGIGNSLSIDVENISRKDTEKIWKNLIKNYDGITKKGNNNEWYTEKIHVPKIGYEGSVKMFMTINEKDKLARTTFLVSKDGEFVNYINNPTEAEEVERIFQDFVYDMKKKSYENETKNEEENLKNLNKDLEKLEKNNRKYHEEIEKCKKKIAEMESKIIRKDENSLQDLNKDLEKQEKNNKKYRKEIEKCKKKIAEMESKISKNEEDQVAKKGEVAEQKVQVEKVLKKLTTHKK